MTLYWSIILLLIWSTLVSAQNETGGPVDDNFGMINLVGNVSGNQMNYDNDNNNDNNYDNNNMVNITGTNITYNNIHINININFNGGNITDFINKLPRDFLEFRSKID
jgi:hypothetical protein